MQNSTLRVAWRNIWRNKKRTLLAIGAIALGQLTLVFVNSLMAGSFNEMIKTVTGPLVGHVQIHHEEWREERATDLYVDKLEEITTALQTLPQVKTVSPRLYAPALAASGEKTDEPADAEPAMIVGVDLDAESGRGGLLGDLTANALPADRSVLVGKILANRLGVKPGELLALIGQDADGFPASDLYRIRGTVESSVDLVKTMGIVMSYENASEFLAMFDQAHEIVVQGEDYNDAETLSKQIASLEAVKETEVLSWQEALPEFVRMINMKSWFDLVFLAIVFVAATAGIANTSMMSTFERKHEFGMLLAMGARPARIIRMVLVESVIIGLLGVALGSALGTTAVYITSQTGIDYAALGGSEAETVAYKGISFSFIIYPQFELRHVLYGLFAVTLTSILAALWPAALAARLEPVEAMRT
ncbi:ABC transporter permease [Candidatus Hydrogenedentota bacterium]